MKIIKDKIKRIARCFSCINMFRKYGAIKLGFHKKSWRKRINNKDFSIICSTCIGGCIYNDLGMQFLSPTINMYINNLDFIKFACNPKYYCSQELEFIDTDAGFPVAMCDDIRLNFNHSKTESDAKRDWERRKTRINYDNIYLIFYYREGYTLEQIRKIEKAPCKRVAVLTHKPLGLDYEVYMKGNGDPEQNFLEKDKYGIRTFEKEWDFVSWINGSD